MPKRVAYLGPRGTHSDEAAAGYAPDAERVPYPSLAHVAGAVEDGEADEAVVPIENSIQGSITDIIDFLINAKRAQISRELVHRVQNYLLTLPGTRLADVRVVFSHPQPLGQCRTYLKTHLADAKLVASASTGGAVLDLQASDQAGAAIGPRRAAAIYGLTIAAKGIDENPGNMTRFLVLGTSDHPRSGSDRTSIAFDFGDNRSGLLYSAMAPFARRGISLTKVESRPTGRKLGRYIFLLDFEGHRTDPEVRAALDELASLTSMLKVLGSYPRAEIPEPGHVHAGE